MHPDPVRGGHFGQYSVVVELYSVIAWLGLFVRVRKFRGVTIHRFITRRCKDRPFEGEIHISDQWHK